MYNSEYNTIKKGKFMFKKTIIMSLVMSALILTACNIPSTDTPSATAVVQIDNRTTYKLYQLYIKYSDSSSWGNDLLASDTYIPGQTKVDFETSKCNKLIDVKVTGLLGSPVFITEQKQLKCGSKFIYKLVN